MKTVGIKELKNNLSAYLREVKRGTRILVSDRSVVVAELHEPGALYSSGGDSTGLADPILAEWIAKDQLLAPTRPKEELPESPLIAACSCVAPGTVESLLDAERGGGE